MNEPHAVTLVFYFLYLTGWLKHFRAFTVATV